MNVPGRGGGALSVHQSKETAPLRNGPPVRRCLLTTAHSSPSDSPRFILLAHSDETTVLPTFPGTRSSNATPHGPPWSRTTQVYAQAHPSHSGLQALSLGDNATIQSCINTGPPIDMTVVE